MNDDELPLELADDAKVLAGDDVPSRRDKFHVDTRKGEERREHEDRREELRFESNRRDGNDRRKDGTDAWSDNFLE